MPFGTAHTYIAHIREYPPPPGGAKGNSENGLLARNVDCIT